MHSMSYMLIRFPKRALNAFLSTLSTRPCHRSPVRQVPRLTRALAKGGVEDFLVYGVDRTIGAAEPDRASGVEIIDHETVLVMTADGDFVDADSLRSRRPGSSQLLLHVEFVEVFDGVAAALPNQSRRS